MRNLFAFFFGNKTKIYLTIFIILFFLSFFGLTFLLYAYITDQSQSIHVIDISHAITIQVVAFLIGIILLFLTMRINFKYYYNYIFLILIGTIVSMSLLFTPLGIEANDATRWLDLGVIQFQPSEILKITAIMFFAYICSNKKIYSNIKYLFINTIVAFSVILGIGVLQPDIGTTVVIFISIFSILLIAHLPTIWWKVILGLSLLIAPLAFLFRNFIFKDYVLDRIETFYIIYFGEITTDVKYSTGYHALQNLEAVRIGGFGGQGLGSLSRFGNINVPELTTDSIFALFASETGFIGVLILILTFLFLFSIFYYIADITKDKFAKYLIVGLTTMFAFQFFVHILVVLGFPATGIPLIFFSKGGSSIVMTFFAIGIILGVLRLQKIKTKKSWNNSGG